MSNSKKFKITFALVGNHKMKKINETYRGKEGSTDVLSFEVKESDEDGIFILGEILVNRERAEEQAKEQGHSFEEEVAELVRHGVLHLLDKHHEEH